MRDNFGNLDFGELRETEEYQTLQEYITSDNKRYGGKNYEPKFNDCSSQISETENGYEVLLDIPLADSRANLETLKQGSGSAEEAATIRMDLRIEYDEMEVTAAEGEVGYFEDGELKEEIVKINDAGLARVDLEEHVERWYERQSNAFNS